MTLPRVTGLRYVVPLREGGSLPAVVDASDAVSYVVKFRGAGQGARALVAEAIVAELGRAAGLPIPRGALVDLDEEFGKSEPDPEIQDILRGSTGLNFGLEYLPGALGYDPAVDTIEPDLAADIVWFDAYLLNVDRTPRNPNILVWESRSWLIDHGAAMYFHHAMKNWRERIESPFPQIADHILLRVAGDLKESHQRMSPRLTEAVMREAIDAVPGEWLTPVEGLATEEEQREAYLRWLDGRLHGPLAWLATAIDAQQREPAPYARRVTHRVV